MEFYVHCGNYRKFIVEAESEEQARKRFTDAYNHDSMLTNGFKPEKITSIEVK